MIRGYERPLYIQPFDHRESSQTKLFGWKGGLTAEQTAAVAAAKLVIYDGFQAAVAGGVPKECAGILVDEQFGAAVLCDAARRGYPQAGPLIEWCQGMLAQPLAYTREHLEDMPEARDWVWTDTSSPHPSTPRPTLSPRKERSDGILNR